MIKTSYFGKLQNGSIEKKDCVSIALRNPKGLYIEKYNDLIPSKSILKEYKYNGGNWKKYVNKYVTEILHKLDVNKVAADLDGKILLCYEGKNNSESHRHLVAAWLRAYGYECEEL